MAFEEGTQIQMIMLRIRNMNMNSKMRCEKCRHANHSKKRHADQKGNLVLQYVQTEYGLMRVISPSKVTVHQDDALFLQSYESKLGKMERQLGKLKQKLGKYESLLRRSKSRSCSHSSVGSMKALRQGRIEKGYQREPRSNTYHGSVKSSGSVGRKIGSFVRMSQKQSAEEDEYELYPPEKMTEANESKRAVEMASALARNRIIHKNSIQSKTTPLEYSEVADEDYNLMSSFLQQESPIKVDNANFFESFIQSESGKENLLSVNNSCDEGQARQNCVLASKLAFYLGHESMDYSLNPAKEDNSEAPKLKAIKRQYKSEL